MNQIDPPAGPSPLEDGTWRVCPPEDENVAIAISAKEVGELRNRTGAGMMDCKKALEETNGDMDKAVELLRSKGAAKNGSRPIVDVLETVAAPIELRTSSSAAHASAND